MSFFSLSRVSVERGESFSPLFERLSFRSFDSTIHGVTPSPFASASCLLNLFLYRFRQIVVPFPSSLQAHFGCSCCSTPLFPLLTFFPFHDSWPVMTLEPFHSSFLGPARSPESFYSLPRWLLKSSQVLYDVAEWRTPTLPFFWPKGKRGFFLVRPPPPPSSLTIRAPLSPFVPSASFRTRTPPPSACVSVLSPLLFYFALFSVFFLTFMSLSFPLPPFFSIDRAPLCRRA